MIGRLTWIKSRHFQMWFSLLPEKNSGPCAAISRPPAAGHGRRAANVRGERPLCPAAGRPIMQPMSDAQIGTIAELLALTPEELRPVVTRLRELVHDVDPRAVEVVRLGDRAATYGVGPRKMKDGYAYIAPQRGWVNLGFYQGAALDDPSGLLEGTGKKLRHVKVRTPEEVDNPALKALLATAVAARRASEP